MAEPGPPLATLLVADDDPAVRQSLERTLTREGYAVVLAPDGQAALERLQAGGVDLVLSDLKMPGLTGLELLRQAKAVAPDVDVILLTAFGTVEEAVRAMKDGATDFLTKPFQRAQLTKVVRQALERRDLIAQNRALQKRLDDLLRQGNMIGTSPAFRKLMTLVQQVADSSATVLIHGRERDRQGAGRARDPRALEPRATRPFVAVNCAALPETLLESELFGHEKGAFTGAVGRKRGPLRAGRRRHPVPRRDRRPLAGDPGQAPARAAGRRVRAGGRHPEPARSTCASWPPPTGTWPRLVRGQALPRRPLLPPERHHDPGAAAARAARGHPGPRRALPAPVRGQEQPAARRLHRRGPRLPRGLFVAGQRARARERRRARRRPGPRRPRGGGRPARRRCGSGPSC